MFKQVIDSLAERVSFENLESLHPAERAGVMKSTGIGA